MKGDNTRSTFDKKKHYSSVRMQQGRVQLDADWNEHVEIAAHRIETETIDSMGHCGAPMHHGGFHLVAKVEDLTEEEQKRPENQNPSELPLNNFYISGGRYYVDGILCENEQIIPFTNQPDVPLESLPDDFPDSEEILKEISPPGENGIYLAYLDVWTRHITALEDSNIREKALGGPDTATRAKTIWQVKHLRAGEENADINCLSKLQEWDDLISPPNGQLAAQAEKTEQEDKPCELTPGAGYRRLENQLYRVEVHKGGELGEATFKWSRDNGSIVSKWEEQNANNVNELIVSSTGRDKVLNFASGQWVELTDDTRELLGQPGILVQLSKVEGQVLTIDPDTIKDPADPSAASVDKIHQFLTNPKIRRWDSAPLLEPTDPMSWYELEDDGIQVQFTNGSYKTGDYWLIPARTASADVEWPLDKNDEPKLQAPHGIRHHYCRLALLHFNGTQITVINDCRNIFPPVTDFINLFYVSGDGQEAMPDDPLLRKPLQVGVSNGKWSVPKAKVRFKRLSSGGAIQKGSSEVVSSSPNELVVLTGTDGVAECNWRLDSNMTSLSQELEATLLDATNNPVHLPIRFTASLSAKGIEPGIKIKEILRFRNRQSEPLMIDDELLVEDFIQGLYIGCDAPIDPAAVNGRAIGTVSLELPYPLNYSDREMWGLSSMDMVGFEPIIIAGEFRMLPERENHVIVWEPDEYAEKWLQELFPRLYEREMQIERLLVRLNLNGNLIWGQNDPQHYLDADLFANPVNSGPIPLIYPGGDGRRGGALNMRFWLIDFKND